MMTSLKERVEPILSGVEGLKPASEGSSGLDGHTATDDGDAVVARIGALTLGGADHRLKTSPQARDRLSRSLRHLKLAGYTSELSENDEGAILRITRGSVDDDELGTKTP
jgi:hypothetical protein